MPQHEGDPERRADRPTAVLGDADRLGAVVAQSPDAVIVTDVDGAVVDWNAAATTMLGYEDGEVRGRLLEELAAQRGATPAEQAVLRRALGGEIVRYEGSRQVGDSELEVSVVVSPLRDGEGGLTGAVAVVRDVTALRAAERDRDRAAARARFVATASRLLAESLDPQRTFDAVASLMVPDWADVSLLALRNADGHLEVRTAMAVDPAHRGLIEDLFARYTHKPLPGGILERVLLGGPAVLVPDLRLAPPLMADPRRRALHEMGGRSLILAPLRIRGEVLGILVTAMTVQSRRRFGPEDADLVQDVADRAAQAIDNARLYEAERKAQERFHAAFDHAPTGIAIIAVDEAGGAAYVEVNPALCDITGFSRDELVGGDAAELAPVARGVYGNDGERRLVRADGEERWVQVRSAPLRGEREDTGTVVIQVQDITDRRRFQRELEHLASHDSLTGLLNRRRFEEELERALAGVRRHGEPSTVVTLDLDNFKHVNDTYGHAAGDELLREVAASLRERVRATDSVGRLGGDEFGIVLTHTGPQEAAAVARDLLEALRTRVGVRVEGRTVRVTASAGLRALDAEGPQTAGEQLGEADMAMYDAKERGRDRLSVVGEVDLRPERVRSRMRWAERIRDALDNDRFVLYEQPITDLRDGRVRSAELLIRMVDEEDRDDRVVEPAAFLPVAERYGHIRQIDRWVVRRAVELLRDRQAAGSPLGADVNLSGDSITDASVVDYIVSEIRNAGIDPAGLTFEVTETAAIGNLDRARRLARQLAELGCGFALDDFGAGFGSFAYLKHLPLDLIKIDGDFIRSLPSSRQDQVTVRAIVDIARDRKKLTVAEYVQDAASLELLRELGVDRAQGFHVGRPRPARTLPEF